MKKITTLLLLIISIAANAQWTPVDINFESVTNSMITIDTTQPNNVWEIGRPHKTLFDTAQSAPNVIVTDTVNNYPVNNTSSFQFTIYDSAFILNGWSSWQMSFTEVEFWQKMDTDTLHDGGYIEYSIDSGTTWTNIVNNIPWYYNFDTLFDGTPGFTGKHGSFDSTGYWEQHWISFGWCGGQFGFPLPTSVILRFTFKSDSINTNKEGWMIDDIHYANQICEGVNEQSNDDNISIFPNPAETNFEIKSKYKIESIKIINVLGEQVASPLSFFQGEGPGVRSVNMDGISPGIYFIEIQTEKGRVNKKIIKQ